MVDLKTGARAIQEGRYLYHFKETQASTIVEEGKDKREKPGVLLL